MVSSRQQSQSSLLRDAWVEIDLDAIEKNIGVIKSWLGETPKSGIMAVVKSDAYGHGARRVSEILVAKGASWLAVASVDEGIDLREGDQNTNILILGPAPFWAVDNALDHNLDLTVTSMEQLEAVEKHARKSARRARIHLKVDTGMHRLGLAPERFGEALERAIASPNLEPVSVFSHLAMASDREAVDFQRKRFEETIRVLKEKEIKLPCHLASSEAAEKFPDTHYDLVRIGIFLYGLRPRGASLDLHPALSVRGRIMSIVEVPEGESAGYNWTWTASRNSRLASIPIGYADGVSRKLSNNIYGYLMGKKIPQTGMISMDQMLFDITDLPEAQEGDVITLIGS
ncbi:MAG: alanine racemase [Cyanobacteriota/Melainabacteria group bacterium]